MNRLAAEREDVGLQSVFKSVFPISDFRENSSLEFIEYSIGNWECKCGRLTGLEHLRAKCAGCGTVLVADPVRRRRRDLPVVRPRQRRAGRHLRSVRHDRADEAEVRRRGVPGARHDVRRAPQGHDPAGRLEQGPRDGRQDDPRHQGAGGLLRRHPADGRPRHLHHQRHRARHRQPVAPLAGRVLPHGRQEPVRRADHPVPRLVGRVRVRREEPALRPHRPQAEVPGHRVPPRARPARGARDPADLLHDRRAGDAERPHPVEGGRLAGGPPVRAGAADSGLRTRAAHGQEDPPRPDRGAEEGRRRGDRTGRRPSARARSRRPTSSIRPRAR